MWFRSPGQGTGIVRNAVETVDTHGRPGREMERRFRKWLKRRSSDLRS